MDQSIAIGIDFGTSTSEIAYFVDGRPRVVPDVNSGTRSPIVPSLVSIDRGGNLVLGERAKSTVDIPGQGIREVKRLLGTGEMVVLNGISHRPEELAALIMKHLVSNAELALRREIRDVVLSVPANFPDQARFATLNAGKLAGLNITSLINEPTAAALAFGAANVDADEKIVVFDFGGGTLDITVLDMAMGVIDVRASYGDPKLGGKDFDAIMMEIILSKFKEECPDAQIPEGSMRQLKAEAEQAKIFLSGGNSVWVQMPGFASTSSDPRIDLEVEVTRAEFRRASAGLLSKVRECMDRAVKAANIEVAEIGRVLLVGGTTYMPSVRETVAEFFGQEPRTDVDPDLAVSMGACIKAADDAGVIAENKRQILADVAPLGLGVMILSYYGQQPVRMYDPLIIPNQPLPYSVSREYNLVYTDQTSVDIGIFQSYTSKSCPIDSPDISFTGIQGEIIDIPPSGTGIPHPVRLDFRYPLDGLITLHAEIPATGQSVDMAFSKTDARMDEEDMLVGKQRVDDLWKLNPRARQCESLIERAVKIIEAGANDKCPQLKVAVAALKAALEDGGTARIDDCENALIDLLMDIQDD
jgi:molecular chaperone DnaK